MSAKEGPDVLVKNPGVAIPVKFKRLPKELGPLIILLGLVLILALVSPRFFSVPNLINILMLAPIPLILAIGGHFVIQTGSVDLSVEGVMAVSGVVAAMLIQNTMTSLDLGVLGILAGVATGALLGAVNGFVYVKGRIPSFIVTLGVSLACLGFATIMYGGNPISLKDIGLQNAVVGRHWGLPSIFWWGVGFFVFLFLFERYSALSRHIKAVGGNEDVAKQAGVPVNRVKIAVFAIAGACYGLAGGLNTVRLMTGSSDTVNGFLFTTITAIVVGGTALTGGRGSITGATIGVFIVTVLGNGMILLSVNPYLQAAVQGVVLIIAIAVTSNRRALQFVK